VRGLMNVGDLVGLGQGRRPRRLHAAVLAALLQVLVPLLGPALERLGVRPLNVGTVRQHLLQVVADFVAVLAALHGALVLADLPEAVTRRFWKLFGHGWRNSAN